MKLKNLRTWREGQHYQYSRFAECAGPAGGVYVTRCLRPWSV